MSALGERTLLAYLTDEEGVAYLARIGVPEEIIPTPSMRPVVTFALRHFSNTGKPPTTAVLLTEYADAIEAAEVDLDAAPDESVEWALESLKASFARKESQKFNTEFAEAMSLADTSQKVDVVGEFASRLAKLAMRLQPRTAVVDFRESADDMLAEYDFRVANQGQIIGIRTGLPEYDYYTGGIWPGELGIFAAPTKMGKSWFLDQIAYAEWQAGRIGALFTLENTVGMTQGRIACIALGLSADDWQRGTLDEESNRAVREWVEDVLKVSDTPLPIFCPGADMRTPHAIVQMARAHEADSVIIDQLTFMNPTEEKAGQSRTYEVGDILHDLKVLLLSGRHPLPCAMAHQVNREGVKAAEKEGRLMPYHMADSAEVERTADLVATLYQTQEQRAVRRAVLAIAAARRVLERAWEMNWNPAYGSFRIMSDVDLSNVNTATGEIA